MAHATRLSWIILGTLALLALYFYQERMLFSDMAFQTFHILREGQVQVQSGRFGAIATQVFPWAAQWLGLPLRGVLVAYSLGHVLWPLALFLWVRYRLKRPDWALILALCTCFLTVHTFFWLSEMPQGLVFLVALLAWADAQTRLSSLLWWQWLMWIAATVTAFYFHPMVLYAAVFALVWLLLYNQNDRGKQGVFVTNLALFMAIWVVKYKILPLDWYDAQALERARIFAELWPNWLNIPSNRDFLRWCLSDYWALLPALLAVTAWLLYQRRWLLATWSIGFPFAFVLLVNVPFHTGDQQFYLENLYLPLALCAVLPLVRLAFDSPRLPYVMALFALFFLVKIAQLYFAGQLWHTRLTWLRTTLAEHAGPKMAIAESTLPKPLLRFTWGLPYETLLLSALNGPQQARTIVVLSPNVSDSLLQRPDLLLGPFKHYPISELPQRYFQLPETSGYRELGSR
jgi:hypothetical protein